MEDVRETGPVGLKGLNTQTQKEVEPIDLGSTFNWGIARVSDSYGIGIDIPIYSDTGDLGKSRFDKLGGLTAEDISDVQNMRAEAQSSIGKWINGIAKGGVLAGTTFLDGTVGLIYGLGDVLTNITNEEETGWETFSRLWDNEFSNGLRQINEMSENWLPNYKTKEERDRAWYQNLGTANFWADTFLKNMGFTVGAFASGNVFTKVLTKANLLKTGLGAATAGSVYGAINEARVEANHNSNDFYKTEQSKIQDSYKVEYDTIWNDGFLNLEQKYQLTEQLNTKYKALQEDLDLRKSKMGLGTLIGNTVFLSLNDFFTMGRLYAQGFNRAKREGKKLAATADDLFASDQSIGKHVTKQGNTWIADNVSKASAIGKGVTKGLLEGHEEMAQRFMAGTSGEVYDTDSPDAYFNASLDSNAKVETETFLNAAIKGFKDSYGNSDAYEEFAVGFLTGALGIPTFGRVNNSDASTILGRGKPVGLTGGILGELSNNAADAAAEEIIIKARQRADLMVEEHQITKEAKEAALAIMQQAKDESNAIISASKAKAMEIMDKSERWSNDMRKNASAYVENVIKDTDETLTRSVNDIRTLRQSLRDALSASGESRPELD